MYEMQLFLEGQRSTSLRVFRNGGKLSRIALAAYGAMWYYANRSSAVALNRNVCTCLLLFTAEYERVRPVLWLCEMENLCAYLNPAYLPASGTTATAVQETHHCPANGGAVCVDKREGWWVNCMPAREWDAVRRMAIFCLMQWNW